MTILVRVRVRLLTVSKCSLVSLSNQCFVVLLVMERRLAGLDDGHSTRRIRFKSFCRSDQIRSNLLPLGDSNKSNNRNGTPREPVSTSALLLCIPQSQSQLRRVTSTSRSCSRAVFENVTSCAASVFTVHFIAPRWRHSSAGGRHAAVQSARRHRWNGNLRSGVMCIHLCVCTDILVCECK